MRKTVFILILFTLLFFGDSSEGDTGLWYSFQDEKTDLIGYKDGSGTVQIPPKFILADALKFDNIMAVIEPVGKTDYQNYYLLKNGKKVGIGNMYQWGNYPDCEAEGKIRFRDTKTDKVGFYDANGEIAIPATYTEALQFRNNMAIVLEGGKRACLNGAPFIKEKPCEHWTWKGGASYLVNDKNEKLIAEFEQNRYLDWLSVKVSENKPDDPIRDSFRGINGKYYSFINVKKEFEYWFSGVFIPKAVKGAFKNLCFNEVTFWSEKDRQWHSVDASVFLQTNKKILKQKFIEIDSGKRPKQLLKQGLNPFIFEKEIYQPYFDYCGRAKEWQYPVFDVVTSFYKGKEMVYQENYEFLRTDTGEYRLISLSLKGN